LPLEDQPKKVLIMAYEFPPMGGIPSVWVTKYVKFLPAFGWRPVVLTVKDAPTNLLDKSLEDDLPQGLYVRKSFSLEPTRLVRWVRSIRNRKKEENGRDQAGSVIHSYTRLPFNVLKKIKAFMIPDEKIGWFPFALRAALKVVRDTGPAVIFSTSPPYTTHLVAMACQRLTGLPWVCEFRDPWIDFPHYEPVTMFNRALVRWMERSTVARADVVIAAMPGIIEGFKARYGDEIANKCRVITNGFDPDDYSGEVGLEERFTITWIGSIYGELYPRALLEAASRLIEDKEIPGSDLRIRFVGTMDVESYESIMKAEPKGVVEVLGFVDHRDCIEYMRSSHLLTLKLAEGKMSEILYTGKMFEYLGCGRPILAMVGEGDTCHFLKNLGVGVVVKPDDIQEIYDAILHYYSLYRSNSMPSMDDPDVLRKFNRKRLTGELAQIFNEVAEDNKTNVEGWDDSVHTKDDP